MGHIQPPEVSVVVVSDYNGEPGHQKSWTDERNVLTSLANQDFQEPFEVILVENDALRGSLPSDVAAMVPNLRVVFSQETRSAELKDHGVSVTSSPFVAIIEADCRLNAEWLRVLVDVLRSHPEVSAVSSKTTYGAGSLWRRCFTLLDRAYMDLGHTGPTRNLSNNGALCRRELLERYPYPEANSPFISAALRVNQINRDGHVLFFEPRAVATHAFGWKMERDLRRNRGFQHTTLAANRRMSTILGIQFRKMAVEARHCLRIGRKYLRWFDWPAVTLLLVIVRFLEIPGILDTLRNEDDVPGTAYR